MAINAYEIPLTPQAQTFSILLNGTSYTLTLMWRAVNTTVTTTITTPIFSNDVIVDGGSGINVVESGSGTPVDVSGGSGFVITVTGSGDPTVVNAGSSVTVGETQQSTTSVETLTETVLLGGWVLDIADSANNPLVQGIPLVTGCDLLQQFGHLGIGGALWVLTDGDPMAVPTYHNLGSLSHLYFVTTWQTSQ